LFIDPAAIVLQRLDTPDAATAEAMAECCNSMLDCSAWGPPPWSADQWVTLAMALALAQDSAADA
jgi:hypothetical protein